MALVTCPECNAEMSSEAHACPKCGKPNTTVTTKKKNSLRDAGCLLMVVGLLISIVPLSAELNLLSWVFVGVGLVILLLALVRK